MSWCKYIVDDKHKIKYEISRGVNEEEFEEIVDNMGRIENDIDKLNEYYDEINSKKIPDKTRHYLFDIGLDMHEIGVMCMDMMYFYDFMFMIWLKNHDIDYRVISEYDLDSDDEPAKDYITVSMWD